jgi:hypothetical protein
MSVQAVAPPQGAAEVDDMLEEVNVVVGPLVDERDVVEEVTAAVGRLLEEHGVIEGCMWELHFG